MHTHKHSQIVQRQHTQTGHKPEHRAHTHTHSHTGLWSWTPTGFPPVGEWSQCGRVGLRHISLHRQTASFFCFLQPPPPPKHTSHTSYGMLYLSLTFLSLSLAFSLSLLFSLSFSLSL